MLEKEGVKMAVITRSKSGKAITVGNISDTEELSMPSSINSIGGTSTAGGGHTRSTVPKDALEKVFSVGFAERKRNLESEVDQKQGG
jgi:hypothetical protein